MRGLLRLLPLVVIAWLIASVLAVTAIYTTPAAPANGWPTSCQAANGQITCH